MIGKINKQNVSKWILKLYNEAKQPDGSIVIPDSWKPYLTILVLMLECAKMFTNDATDKIIDIIIEAIEKLEK